MWPRYGQTGHIPLPSGDLCSAIGAYPKRLKSWLGCNITPAFLVVPCNDVLPVPQGSQWAQNQKGLGNPCRHRGHNRAKWVHYPYLLENL